MAKIRLDIVTPERQVLTDEVDEVVAAVRQFFGG